MFSLTMFSLMLTEGEGSHFSIFPDDVVVFIHQYQKCRYTLSRCSHSSGFRISVGFQGMFQGISVACDTLESEVCYASFPSLVVILMSASLPHVSHFFSWEEVRQKKTESVAKVI